MQAERETVQSLYNIESGATVKTGCRDVFLLALNLHLIVGDAPWDPPGGIFDPNVLIQEGVMTNVENGFGIVTAGYRLVEDVLPPKDVVEAACFGYPY